MVPGGGVVPERSGLLRCLGAAFGRCFPPPDVSDARLQVPRPAHDLLHVRDDSRPALLERREAPPASSPQRGVELSRRHRSRSSSGARPRHRVTVTTDGSLQPNATRGCMGFNQLTISFTFETTTRGSFLSSRGRPPKLLLSSSLTPQVSCAPSRSIPMMSIISSI